MSCAVYAVIMAGGLGERFWPMSRPSRPKHLLPLFRGKTLVELTLARLAGVLPLSNVRIITSSRQHELMRQTFPQLKPEQILVEPVGMDTAAAVALATRAIQLEDPQASIAMLPADHFIADIGAFQNILKQAFSVAQSGEKLVTIGITPTRPATGYGYMERSQTQPDGSFHVASFKEKPNLVTAQQYLITGNYFWNSGIFVWSVSSIIAALKKYAGSLWQQIEKIDFKTPEQIEKVYAALPKISIDYAVMEHAPNVYGIRADFGWDDVGEWTALGRLNPSDADGNVTRGNICTLDCSANIMVNEDESHLLAVLDTQGLVIVHSSDATLVAPAMRSQELKRLLAELRKNPKLKEFTL